MYFVILIPLANDFNMNLIYILFRISFFVKTNILPILYCRTSMICVSDTKNRRNKATICIVDCKKSKFEILFSENGVDAHVDNTPVVAIGLSQSTFVGHARFLHYFA